MDSQPPSLDYPEPTTVDDLEHELAFIDIQISTLDPGSYDYQNDLAILEARRAHYVRQLESFARPQSQSSNQMQPLSQHIHGADVQDADAFWRTAMGGHPGSDHSSSNSISSNPFLDNLTGAYDMGSDGASSGVKRARPESSYLDAHQHASKRPTPDPSNVGTPASSTSSFEMVQPGYVDRERRRQLASEAAIQRAREAAQRDSAYAQGLSMQNGSSAASSQGRPSVQTILNFNGGYHRPAPSVKPAPPSSQHPTTFSQYSGRSHSYPHLPQQPRVPQPVKTEPPSFQQRLPQRPRQSNDVWDLTLSDSEDDLAEISPDQFTPNHRRPAHPAANSRQYQTPNPAPYQMPGTFPSSNPQYGYGGQPTEGPSSSHGGLWAQASTGFTNGLRNLGGHTQQLGNLLYGSSSAPVVDLDDDDDDDIVYQGARQLPGYANPGYGQYAGFEQLYQDRYEQYAAYDPTKSKEEIQALLGNIRPDEDMPAHLRVQTPEDMTVRLHKYQELGLTWLKNCEEGSNSGGILADDMGLGKTIQMLSLMVTRKSENPRCKTTLIIAPVALMRQWKQEIRDKLKAGRYQLSVFVHHSTHKAKNFNDLRSYDVVLTTYGTISSELKKLEKFLLRQKASGSADIQPTPAEKTVFLAPEARWYRVILDEAQCIKNRNTQAAKGACQLNAKYRFCVTGTPMMNNVEELYSLIKFLRIKPYSTWERFRLDFNTPLKSPDDNTRGQAMRKLQIVCKSIMLRRTKKSKFEGQPILVLPERSTTIDNPSFDDDELGFYKALETQSQLQFNKYLKRGTIGTSYSAILVLLLRLRQACCHPHLIKDFGVAAAADMTEDQMLDLARELDDSVVERIKATGGNFECPVCYDVTPNPAIFIPCGHDTCSECFTRIADPANAIQHGDEGGAVKCPNCRGRIDPKRLTDFNSFKKVHMPELLTAEERAQIEDDDDDDSGTDSDDESEVDSKEEMSETDSLNGFVVPDDEGEEESSTDGNVTSEKAKTRVVKKEDGESHDEDDLDVNYSDVKEEAGQEPEGVAGPSSAVPTTATGEKPKSKKRSKGKGKAKKKDKKAKNVTLAELKKLATRNKAAKKKYLRRLRKDWVSSAKIDKTLEILKKIMEGKEGEKVLIFSQWTSLLDLLEIPIDHEEYGYRRYDGSMSATMRGDAVDDFKDPSKNVRIMLVSLKAGNAGLNLNMASQVIILDPFWNPYIEEQAIDRAHRIGQTRPVQVHRVLIKDTVEDRIIELQEKKRALISEALDEKQAANLSRLGVQELAYLFGVTHDPSQHVNYTARDRRH